MFYWQINNIFDWTNLVSCLRCLCHWQICQGNGVLSMHKIADRIMCGWKDILVVSAYRLSAVIPCNHCICHKTFQTVFLFSICDTSFHRCYLWWESSLTEKNPLVGILFCSCEGIVLCVQLSLSLSFALYIPYTFTESEREREREREIVKHNLRWNNLLNFYNDLLYTYYIYYIYMYIYNYMRKQVVQW